MVKNNDTGEKKEKNRYCESRIVEEFLQSKDGISFLINSQNEVESNKSQKRKKTLYSKIEDLIDFYTTWGNTFPVRKNIKISKYEFLKSIEAYCNKKEIHEMFEKILDI